jgi:hypothetical protein
LREEIRKDDATVQHHENGYYLREALSEVLRRVTETLLICRFSPADKTIVEGTEAEVNV